MKSSIRNGWISLLLAVIMTAGLFVPAFAEEEIPAAETDAQTQMEEEVAHTLARNAEINDSRLTFSTAVITDELLGPSSYTDTLKATGSKKSIKLTWKSVPDPDTISGYIIARRTSSKSAWKEIARVGRAATSYTDNKAAKKDTAYSYTLLAYSDTDQGTMVSKPARWASAVTTKSKKKNVYTFSINSPAKVSAVAVGSSVTMSLKFKKKPYSKSIRWTSSNNKVATVTSSGKIKGISRGKATLYGRTHSGRVIKTAVTVFEPYTAQGMVDIMESWMGYGYSKHKGIVDIYNSVKPHPIGYRLRYGDAWCAGAVTAASIRNRSTGLTGRECSVDRFIKIFKKKGIWIGNKNFIPKTGDLITYNWLVRVKPSNASHIGVVESVDGDMITVIEGNKGGKVARRTVKAGWKYIKGYARPHYREPKD